MFTTKEVAAKLRISPRSVQRLLRSRELRSLRVGGLRRIPESALADYLSRNLDSPT